MKESSYNSSKLLIIPCHFTGMGSMLQSLISGLLFAELTKRTPIVNWHENCIYLDQNAQNYHNAFTDFFRLKASANIQQITNEDTQSIISQNPPIKEGYHAGFERTQSLDENKKDILIFPINVSIKKIKNTLPQTHSLAGATDKAIAKYISAKYLELEPNILRSVNNFWGNNFSVDQKTLCIHIRVGDKHQESIMPDFRRYKSEADKFLKKHPTAAIFIASDSDQAIDYFNQHYPNRIITSESTRSDDSIGVHNTNQDGKRLGIEIIFDVECLSRGDHFIGFKESNVFFWVCNITQNGREGKFTYTSVRPGVKEIFESPKKLKRKIKYLRRLLLSKIGVK